MDFGKLLSAQAFEAKAPALAPEGINYPGEILSWKADKSRGADPKPIIKITMRADDWADNVPEDERKGDITKKRFERDFFVDDTDIDSMFYVDQLLRSCNISGPAPYDELLPQLVGAKVHFTIRKRTYEDKKTHEMREALDVVNIVGR